MSHHRSSPITPVMKRLLLTITACATALPALAQYTLDWWTIDGGGGASTGGVYTVEGTVGQPEAGQLSGGAFALTGGFWSLLAADPNPPVPRLEVRLTTTNTVVVSWPGPATGWKLQTTPNLATFPIVWTELPSPYSADGANLCFIQAAPAGHRFYRLSKP
jgi:hypothetical protein